MQGIVFHGQREIELATLPDPTPRLDDAIVRITASGMCGSDLHTYRGPHIDHPVVGGHEPAGVVVDVGAHVDRSWIGRRVMVHHYFGCGLCDQCRAGWTQMCRSGATAMGAHTDGSHAELARVPAVTLLEMPEGLSDLAAAAIGCGTGTAWGALRRLDLHGSDTVAIFGQGPVGLAATQLATAMGSRVIALDISDQRLERATEFGAHAVIDPSAVDPVEAILELTHGRGVSKSLETSGASSAASAALHVLDRWGTAVWVGVGSTIHFDLSEILFRQITAKSSWTLSYNDMADCARFVLEREVDVDALFTDRWNLAEYAEAYALLDAQSSGKGVFLP
jgi:2-desacetyl-2-hydroxyethyl bacteriochlorophyllide A dehydrogenase